jgi:hypothetical protein
MRQLSGLSIPCQKKLELQHISSPCNLHAALLPALSGASVVVRLGRPASSGMMHVPFLSFRSGRVPLSWGLKDCENPEKSNLDGESGKPSAQSQPNMSYCLPADRRFKLSTIEGLDSDFQLRPLAWISEAGVSVSICTFHDCTLRRSN